MNPWIIALLDFLIGVFSAIFSGSLLKNYMRTKDKSKIYGALFFISFGIAWVLGGINMLTYSLNISDSVFLVQTMVLFFAVAPIALSSFFFRIFSPKQEKYVYYFSAFSMIILAYLTYTNPVVFLDNDFQYSDLLIWIFALMGVINLFVALLFIILGKKSQNPAIKKMCYLFGIGILLFDAGTVISGISLSSTFSSISKIIILLGYKCSYNAFSVVPRKEIKSL